VELDVNSPLTVSVADPGTGLDQTTDIQFAGLAPGTVGVYQVNIFVPGFPGTTIMEHSLSRASVLPSGENSALATISIFVGTAP
jgi:hypothetical protein